MWSVEKRSDKRAIYNWMYSNIADFIDDCNEVDCTLMVETWDDECGSGEETLDMNHIAWDVAVKVAGAIREGERVRRENGCNDDDPSWRN